MTSPASTDLFLSYAEADRGWVEDFFSLALTALGIRYISQMVPARPASEHSAVADAQRSADLLTSFEHLFPTSRYTVLILTPDYLASTVGRMASTLAVSYGFQTNSWIFIPLRLRPAALPTSLAMLAGLDATNPADWPYVVDRLGKTLDVSPPALPCPYPDTTLAQVTISAVTFPEDLVAPAAQLGAALRPDLVARLVAEARYLDQQVVSARLAVPVSQLVQDTLSALWAKMPRRLMYLRDYEALQTERRAPLVRAITDWADRTLEALSPQQQAIAQALLGQLVMPSPRSTLLSRPHVLSELPTRGSPEDVMQIIGHLVRHTLVVIEGAERPDQRVVRLHEAVLNAWPVLRSWIGR